MPHSALSLPLALSISINQAIAASNLVYNFRNEIAFIIINGARQATGLPLYSKGHCIAPCKIEVQKGFCNENIRDGNSDHFNYR